MTFERRRDAALKLMDEAGFGRWISRPPLWRLFWLLHLEVPPAPFMNLWIAIALHWAYFSTVWGAFMWFVAWRPNATPVAAAVTMALSAGLLFGATAAFVSRRQRRKYRLPAWGDL